MIEGGNGASFDLSVNDSVVLDDVDGNGGQVTNTHPVNTTYSVSETLGNGDPVDPAVWETTTSADCSGTLAAGEHKTCTITNKRKPKLTVVKEIEGGDGSVFDISVGEVKVLDDAGDGANDTSTYAPGGYDVSETFGNGGAIGSDWTVAFSGDCDADGHVSLAYGDAKTCTITNKRKPKLTVVKVIEGGNGAEFDLKVNGSTVLNDVDGVGGQVTNTYPVNTTYSVTETLGNGDPVNPAVWETTLSGDCAGSLAAGDDKTCTITNKRKPKLTVVKVIEGGNGATFDLKVNDATVLNDVDGVGDQVTNTYPVNTTYSVTETLGNGDAVDPAVWETSNSGDCSGTLHAGRRQDLHHHQQAQAQAHRHQGDPGRQRRLVRSEGERRHGAERRRRCRRPGHQHLPGGHGLLGHGDAR